MTEENTAPESRARKSQRVLGEFKQTTQKSYRILGLESLA